MKPKSIFFVPDNLSPQARQQRRHMLARLGLAWLIMMQVMMFAFPGYLRHGYLEAETADTLDTAVVVLNWCSLVLTIPLLLYCAWPIWKGVYSSQGQDVHQRSMNWPIGLGIIIAFVPSAIATFRQSGEVYFESISMFVAFVLTARYLALSARHSAGSAAEGLLEQESAQLSLIANRVGLYFVLTQIALSILSALVWYWFIDAQQAIPVLVALFVMSCPCAMAMAAPSAQAAARGIVLSVPSLSDHQLAQLRRQTLTVAYRCLYGSLAWHLLMIPLAMIGWVQPWLAAITMLVSSLAVACYAWHFYRTYSVDNPGIAHTDAMRSHPV